jgi:hypothetical protein
MKKIISESLFEYMKFTEAGDPIKDMGIGTEKLINDWLLNILDKNDYVLNKRKLTIDTYTTVNITENDITEFPEFIKFNHISGGFQCNNNELITLKGCPIVVSGSFICSWNNLSNLMYGPKLVQIDYMASHNKLTSLQGLGVIKQSLDLSNNFLEDLKGIPETINGSLYIHGNPIKSLKYFPKLIIEDLEYTSSEILNENSIREICDVKGYLINKK